LWVNTGQGGSSLFEPPFGGQAGGLDHLLRTPLPTPYPEALFLVASMLLGKYAVFAQYIFCQLLMLHKDYFPDFRATHYRMGYLSLFFATNITNDGVVLDRERTKNRCYEGMSTSESDLHHHFDKARSLKTILVSKIVDTSYLRSKKRSWTHKHGCCVQLPFYSAFQEVPLPQ
jgi:hypothetical protein